MTIDRRHFLATGLSGLGAFALGTPFLSAQDSRPSQKLPKNILVVLQLAGGNDGLSTIVPYADDAYGKARSATRIAEKDVLKIDSYRGFHPNLRGFQELYGDGKLAIVEGAGYPDPVRSHFRAFDIWHAADARGRGLGRGWIGRMLDETFPKSKDPTPVIHVGSKIPFSLLASVHRPIAFTTPAAYKWIGAEADAEALQESAPLCEHMEAKKSRAPGRDRALSRLRRVLHEAQASSSRVREATKKYQPKATYPRVRLSTSLSTVAALIAGGLSTRVYSLELGGFDTHTNHRPRYNQLMNQVGGALSAFQKDLEAHGVADRVTTLVFSEFGRRVKENASQGLDHGVAGPMFVMGQKVKGGLYGKHPSLTELDRGDLIHTTDFRQVYASIADGWMGGQHEKIFGQKYQTLPLFGKPG